ncbi:hypothetical protein CL629_04470 [bacterium]|nr:hypothetical protein [bacterium]|tara:strand:- start:361 stop:1647 length:1287 start_codon:yes stop_codon:yes gene_type:complete
MKQAVFLDRDGVINKEKGYIASSDEIELIKGAGEAIALLSKLGMKIVVVTNQPQVARGLCDEEDVKEINKKVEELVVSCGGKIDAFYFCPHHPERHHPDIPKDRMKYRIKCKCRKPNIGMLEQAARDLGISPEGNFMIGDHQRDIQAGKKFGCRTILVHAEQKKDSKKEDEKEEEPDFVCEDLLDAAHLIVSVQKMATLILAGGEGRRLRPLTETMPKPMVPIVGKPVLEHLIELNRKEGIKRIIISGSYMFDYIKEYFGDGSRFGVSIEYVDDGEEPLGSGGPLKKCEDILPEHFVVMSGDAITNFAIHELVNMHMQKKGIATIVVRETDHPEDSDIIEVDDTGRAVHFFSKLEKEKKGDMGNTGLFVFKKEALAFAPEKGNLEQDLLRPLIEKEKVYCYINTKYYIKDIGTKERYEKAEKDFSSLT